MRNLKRFGHNVKPTMLSWMLNGKRFLKKRRNIPERCILTDSMSVFPMTQQVGMTMKKTLLKKNK